jgi:hypothetical protein
MHKLSILIIVLLTIFSISAQDKIITIQSDTIQCRIISINDAAIRYEQIVDNKTIIGKIIPLSNVAVYYRSHGKSKSFLPVKKPWLLSFNTGIGHMPWILESLNNTDINDDYNKIKVGVQLTTQAHYLINQSVGMGLRYSFFTSGINGDFLNEINPSIPTYTYFYQRERHYVNYAGVSVLFSQALGLSQRLYLTETISGGMLFYRGENQSKQNIPYSSGYSYVSENALIEGNTVGANLGLTAAYRILPDISLGAGVDLMYGLIKKVDLYYKNSIDYIQEADDYVLPNPINISRINYLISLQITL